MPRSLDFELLMASVRSLLAASPLSGAELAQRLGVSQPTVSRLLRHYQRELLTTGRAKATRHLLRRVVPDVGSSAPLYEVTAEGLTHRVAWLHPVGATGFHVESLCEELDSGTFDDWPWFLHGLRPGGFLGRRLSGQVPDLRLPDEPRNWSADQLLRYSSHHGSNGSGAWIVGELALQRWLAQVDLSRCEGDSRELYPTLANDLFAGAPPGSSAEGEQPKFLVAASAERPERLVKFSPPISGSVGRRVADLLIAEHHALAALARAGASAAVSSVIEADERVFLETERFDRTPSGGRRGLLSLESFDLEFLGDGRRNHWPSIVEHLIQNGRLPEHVRQPVARLHAFGHLVGNTDMHTGNLSFLMRGQRVLGIAPAYDMASMLFLPERGELPERELTLSLDANVPRSIWEWAIEAALESWRHVASDERISPSFRKIAAASATRVERARSSAARLPS